MAMRRMVGLAPPAAAAAPVAAPAPPPSACCCAAYDARPYTERTYAAATATLLSRQKPWVPLSSCSFSTMPRGPAWCPGGRTGQKALRTSPAMTRSAAAHTAPAARRAASQLAADTAVSESSSLMEGSPPAPGSCAPPTACSTRRTYS